MLVGGSAYPVMLSGVAVMPGFMSPSSSGNIVPEGKPVVPVTALGHVKFAPSVPDGTCSPISASVGSIWKVFGGPHPICDPVEAYVGIDGAFHTLDGS